MEHDNATTGAMPELKIDQPVPGFTARTTAGEIRMSDFQGRWLVLFSHPADFTPVCTSEFIAFQTALDQFEALNCALMGLSVDSIYSHIAWLDSIKTHFDTEITFPVIEDMSMGISRAFGMIHDGSVSTATVRSVFFIDPEGILRALIHYPAQVGRSVPEILRVLKALQVAQNEDISLPESWQPGQPAVMNPPVSPPPGPHEGAWYYKTVDLDAGGAS